MSTKPNCSIGDIHMDNGSLSMDDNARNDDYIKDSSMGSSIMDRSITSAIQGLKLNMEEPWERSLSRLLEDGMPAATNDDNCDVNTSAHTTHNSVSPKSIHHGAELMLLGRTESRDYAYAVEGAMNYAIDDNSSIVAISRNGRPTLRRHSSIYRKKSVASSSSTRKLQKSLFDDSDDDESINTADSGRCRLVHKFSNESLFLFCDHRGYHRNHNQQMEGRGDEEDDSDRKDDGFLSNNQRSYSIHQATAIVEDDDYHNSRAWLLYIPDPPNSTRRIQRSMSDLYLPTL